MHLCRAKHPTVCMRHCGIRLFRWNKNSKVKFATDRKRLGLNKRKKKNCVDCWNSEMFAQIRMWTEKVTVSSYYLFTRTIKWHTFFPIFELALECIKHEKWKLALLDDSLLDLRRTNFRSITVNAFDIIMEWKAKCVSLVRITWNPYFDKKWTRTYKKVVQHWMIWMNFQRWQGLVTDSKRVYYFSSAQTY